MLAITTPPAAVNVETEAALLGGMMIENSLIDRVADMVGAEDFAEPFHGRVFTAILKERSLGHVANPVTLKVYFEHDPALAELGGMSYLAKLTGSDAVVIGAVDFARQVKELSQRRALLTGLNSAIELARDYDNGLDDIAAEAEAALASVQETKTGTKEASAAEAVGSMLRRIEEGLPPGVTSGIEAMDDALGPIRPGDLSILAGRPGMAKTACALNYARGAAERGHGVLFVSLEMTADQLAMRLAADICYNGHSGINFSNIEKGDLSREQFQAIFRASDRIRDLPLTIVDLPSIRVGRLNSLVRRHARRFAAKGQKLELVIVDYLQLIDADRASDSRTTEITAVSRGLKQCAKANGVGLLSLAQLSRKVEEREEKRPRLADLRESGSIEQDADNVMFLYRPEYYLLQNEPPESNERRPQWESALQKVSGDIEFICSKRRQGQTGIRHGRFFGCFQAVRS